MLTHDQMATMRAALLFWEEEMCPHPAEMRSPYFEAPIGEQLSGKELADLRSQLATATVCFGLYDRVRDRLATSEVFDSWLAATQHAQGSSLVVTILMPDTGQRQG